LLALTLSLGLGCDASGLLANLHNGLGTLVGILRSPALGAKINDVLEVLLVLVLQSVP
jgi:hypothetical protein